MTDTKLDNILLEEGGWVTHYKGNTYFFHGITTHTETKELMGSYSDAKGGWVRPLSMFFDVVKKGDQYVPRFTRATESEIENYIKGFN